MQGDNRLGYFLEYFMFNFFVRKILLIAKGKRRVDKERVRWLRRRFGSIAFSMGVF